MNRKLIVTLLRNNIQELDLITEGFMEMNEYPKAIINLAQRKISEIQSYIQQLEELKSEAETATVIENVPTETIIEEPVVEIEKSEPKEVLVIKNEATEEAIESTETIESFESTEHISTNEINEQKNVQESITVSESYKVKEITEVTTSTITETKNNIEDTKKTILAEKISSHTLSRNDSLSKADNSISSSLANKKIDDIKQAINIGDRFRFQRELFRGNGEDLNKTLTYINQLATLDEVQSFLQSKYNWELENETTEDFYQIVKRRFI